MLQDKLKGIKVVLFDYDDTLCIHDNFLTERRSSEEWWDSCFRDNGEWYTDEYQCKASKQMDRFALDIQKLGIPMHILTWSNTNMHEFARRRFLQINYEANFDRIFIVGERHIKVKLAEQLCRHMGISKYELLLVDDHPMTREEFKDAGFQVTSPSSVMVWYQ